MLRPFFRSSRLLLALLLLAPSTAQAAGPGTSAATFLNLGYGARALAVGEAFVAVADDVSAVHYNPAGLAFAPAGNEAAHRPYEMLVSHSLHIQDIQMTQMGFLKRPYGFSLTHLGVGGIERRTTETTTPDGTFGASDVAVGASFGKKVNGTGLGVTAKYIRQTIGEHSASAYAVDLGALRRLQSMPLSLGFGIANLGTSVRFVEQAAPLPLVARAGVTYGMTKAFPHLLSLQLDFPRDSGPVARLGFEYAGFGPFALRAGYRTFSSTQRTAALGKALGSTASGLSEFYGMFMGVGFRSKLGTMDYAILPYGELGNAHRFSISLRFGTPQSKMLGVMK